MSGAVRDLASFRRRFVRAEREPDEHQDDIDMFFVGIVCAEFAAHYNRIDCACCGSKDVHRAGSMSAPWKFGVLTSPKTGNVYGYAFCDPCGDLHKSDPDEFIRRVDLAFDGGEDMPADVSARADALARLVTLWGTRWIAIDDTLKAAGWSKSKRRRLMKEVDEARRGINDLFLALDLDGVERRVATIAAATTAIAKGIGFVFLDDAASEPGPVLS